MHLKQSIAILKLILNLIGSQWRRINDDVTCSCLRNEHINRTDAFCTRWSLLRSVAATIMIGYCNSLFWTIDFSSISSKLRNLLIRPILCRWYKHRITMREIDFANYRKVIYPMPFLGLFTSVLNNWDRYQVYIYKVTITVYFQGFFEGDLMNEVYHFSANL